jgi:hypothetical protein
MGNADELKKFAVWLTKEISWGKWQSFPLLSRRVILKGITRVMDQHMIQEYFEWFGELENVEVMTDHAILLFKNIGSAVLCCRFAGWMRIRNHPVRACSDPQRFLQVVDSVELGSRQGDA